MMHPTGKKRFVLLDRDGTLIEERHYLSDPGQVVLLPGAAQGLRSLAEAGFGIVLVTNQSGIARGYFDWGTLNAIHEVLRGLLTREDVVLDGIYVCPHQPKDDCACRKPRPGLALAAAKELGFDPRECVVVGDKACDVELGRRRAIPCDAIAGGLVRAVPGGSMRRDSGMGPGRRSGR
jgi:D-glycero-D-manno-heptose 1,7-bisphosphate phosphatase